MRSFLILLLVAFSINANAQTDFLIMPYLNISDKNQVTLNFQSINDSKISVLVENKKLNSFFSSVEETTEIFKGADFQKINLGNLECDHQLTYTIEGEHDQVLATSKLKAIPCDKNEPLFFGFISDTQVKDPSGQKRAIKISETISELKTLYPFSVIVNTGDVVQHGGRLDDWQNYFTLANIYLKDSYLFAAVGNHDYFESPTVDKAPPQFLNYLRNENSNDLGFTELDLQKVTILMLNSNFDKMSESKFNEQWQWFENKLKENQKINKPVIVSMHHAPYSSSADYIREIPSKLRSLLVPTLEKYSCVKMMLAGHLHMYERSQKGKLPYLSAGPAGGIVNYITYKNPYQVFIRPFVTTISIFKVTDKQIEVTTFTGLKEMIDHFTVDL